MDVICKNPNSKSYIAVSPYSVNKKDTLSVNGADFCIINRKLLQLTAKLTEHYASDIVYLKQHLDEQVAMDKQIDLLVWFREMGVNWQPVSYDYENMRRLAEKYQYSKEMLQLWRLTYSPKDEEQESKAMLQRVVIWERQK